jgi:hypothetical protein
MKLRNFALTLTAAALLQTFAYAGDNTDAIHGSFDRDINREFTFRYLPANVTDADPLDAVNVALLSGPDPVLASFKRDLNHEPVQFKAMPTDGGDDPLDSINVALRCGNIGTINASIDAKHNRC